MRETPDISQTSETPTNPTRCGGAGRGCRAVGSTAAPGLLATVRPDGDRLLQDARDVPFLGSTARWPEEARGPWSPRCWEEGRGSSPLPPLAREELQGRGGRATGHAALAQKQLGISGRCPRSPKSGAWPCRGPWGPHTQSPAELEPCHPAVRSHPETSHALILWRPQGQLAARCTKRPGKSACVCVSACDLRARVCVPVPCAHTCLGDYVHVCPVLCES